jgi:hypothetical protein
MELSTTVKPSNQSIPRIRRQDRQSANATAYLTTQCVALPLLTGRLQHRHHGPDLRYMHAYGLFLCGPGDRLMCPSFTVR